MSEKGKDPKEKKCAICGKDIYAGEEWAYKRREKSERTKWFCSYKCMRAYDAKHGQKKRPEGLPEDLEAAAPKEPVSRAVLATHLEKEIKRGSVIAFLKAEGYKNPYEAYNSVRHYCETKMPELAEVLKPMRDLRKTEVKKVEQVPDLEQLEEQVAEVLNAEVKPIGGTFRYQVTGIETEFGRFDWNVDRTLITFTYEEEEISILPGDWKTMAEQLPEILDVLGVVK